MYFLTSTRVALITLGKQKSVFVATDSHLSAVKTGPLFLAREQQVSVPNDPNGTAYKHHRVEGVAQNRVFGQKVEKSVA